MKRQILPYDSMPDREQRITRSLAASRNLNYNDFYLSFFNNIDWGEWLFLRKYPVKYQLTWAGPKIIKIVGYDNIKGGKQWKQ